MKTQFQVIWTASSCTDCEHTSNRKHKKLRLLLAASIKGRGRLSLYCEKAVEDSLQFSDAPASPRQQKRRAKKLDAGGDAHKFQNPCSNFFVCLCSLVCWLIGGVFVCVFGRCRRLPCVIKSLKMKFSCCRWARPSEMRSVRWTTASAGVHPRPFLVERLNTRGEEIFGCRTLITEWERSHFLTVFHQHLENTAKVLRKSLMETWLVLQGGGFPARRTVGQNSTKHMCYHFMESGENLKEWMAAAAVVVFFRTNARHRWVLQVIKTLLSVCEGAIISAQRCAAKQNFAKEFFSSLLSHSAIRRLIQKYQPTSFMSAQSSGEQ